MTPDGPERDDPRRIEDLALAAAVRVLGVIVERLRDVVPAVDRIVPDVRQDWPDDVGRAWMERAGLARGALVKELEAAQDLIRSAGRAMLDPTALDGMTGSPTLTPRPAPARRSGPQLGGTEGDPVDDERGVSIAELPDDGGPPG